MSSQLGLCSTADNSRKRPPFWQLEAVARLIVWRSAQAPMPMLARKVRYFLEMLIVLVTMTTVASVAISTALQVEKRAAIV